MTFKKGQKPPKKGQKMSDLEVKNDEKAVSTVVENKISDIYDASGTIIHIEEEIGLKKSDLEGKNETSQVRGEIVGNGTTTGVTKPRGRIRFEAQVAPVPMFKIPADIRQYLINKGFGTNVWKKDKEWLEKHGADMKMIEKLKKFLSGEL